MTSRYRNTAKPPDDAPMIPVPGPRPVVWAPRARTIEVVLPRRAPHDEDGAGTDAAPGPAAEPERRPLRLIGMHVPNWWGADDELAPGTDYGFSIDGGPPLPDPRSPRQPHGLLGWSRSFDPAFDWSDEAWQGPDARGAVLDVDVTTFTPEGTLDAAAARLDALSALGVAVVELRTIGSVAGVLCPHLYTVCEEIGGPRALQRFVDAAHAHGIGVSLGVAYHRAAPGAAFLEAYAPYLAPLRTRRRTPGSPLPSLPLRDEPAAEVPADLPSGRRINLDRAGSREVHDWVVDSAERWFDDFHVDALRIARVQDLADASPVHLLVEVARTADAASLAHGRPVRLVGECETAEPRLLVPAEQGGRGLGTLWVRGLERSFHALVAGAREGDATWFNALSRILTMPDAAQIMLGLESTERVDEDGQAIVTALLLASAFVPRLEEPATDRLRAWTSTLLRLRRAVRDDAVLIVRRGPGGVVLVQRGNVVTVVNVGPHPRTALLPSSRRAWSVAARWSSPSEPADAAGPPSAVDPADRPGTADTRGTAGTAARSRPDPASARHDLEPLAPAPVDESSVRVAGRSAVVLTSR
ncbi:hypothetical protein [Oerskovia sp. Root22]|uniref:hypothetical protein n=1 Tax=Oerskovia sp. Root22 TaxID=1736494 RepID=UPI00070187D2|nr:hypothetical protein [Oerskovia sp. Root22]KRC35693.1 hypothetical protein ASE15_11370 [Oerskovia sp. Root22]